MSSITGPRQARARRGAAFPEHGYWWLAWTWENLLYACPICNRAYKRDAFPLAGGSKVLDTGASPPGHERPLLIDPAAEDPLDAIQFRPVRLGRKQEWRPFGKNERGRITIETLGLDREDLRELYRRHVNDTVRGKLDGFRRDLRSEDARHIAGSWRRLVRSLLRPGAPFAGLSHDVLDHELDAALRERWRLSLPRPPVDIRAG